MTQIVLALAAALALLTAVGSGSNITAPPVAAPADAHPTGPV